jgi:hypothetical protein
MGRVCVDLQLSQGQVIGIRFRSAGPGMTGKV